MARTFALETLTDDEGSVRLGWIADTVLYAALTGGMSAALGARYVARLANFVALQSNVRFFGDLLNPEVSPVDQLGPR